MTQEQYKRLSKFEIVLRSAVNSRYIRLMDSRTTAEFVDICRELNVFVKPNCGACMLKAATTLGTLYFSYQSKITQDDARERQTSTDDKTIKPTSPEPSVSPDSSDVVSKQNYTTSKQNDTTSKQSKQTKKTKKNSK